MVDEDKTTTNEHGTVTMEAKPASSADGESRSGNPDSEASVEKTDKSQDEKEETPSTEQNFQELYEESIKQMSEGEIISGTVLRVSSESVDVDIGYKSEGQIKPQEFMDRNGDMTVKPGDNIEVLLVKREDETGEIVLSKREADKIRLWTKLENASNSGEPVDGKIVAKVKGGFEVDIGAPAFMPGSHADIKLVKNPDSFLGIEDKFKILKFNPKRTNIVVSRRLLMEQEREVLKEKTVGKLEKGRILEGKVKNLTDYGAFVDLGGIDGLLHITDMSWVRLKHPSDLLKVDQEIKVKVLSFDPEKQKVSLGYKQLQPDPWEDIESNYPVGSRLHGKVISVVDYGAFVELENGIEGLIHVSEMSWTKRLKHPNKILSVGDELEVQVLGIDKSNRRISLGLKQVTPNPWDEVALKYPVGSVITGRIRNVAEFGIFIGIEEGIDGLVHISDISWTKRIKHPGELYKKGQEVTAMVLSIDKLNERFSLGIKQLTPDPWIDIKTRLRPGDSITGKIVNMTEFGIFIEIEEGVEGLIHVTELSTQHINNPQEHFKVGQELTAEILSIVPSERRIRLSLKSLEQAAEQSDMAQYINNKDGGNVTIGDLLNKAVEGGKLKLSGTDANKAAEIEKADAQEPAAEEKAAEEEIPEPEEEKAAEEEMPEPEEEKAAEEEPVKAEEKTPEPEEEKAVEEDSQPEEDKDKEDDS